MSNTITTFNQSLAPFPVQGKYPHSLTVSTPENIENEWLSLASRPNSPASASQKMPDRHQQGIQRLCKNWRKSSADPYLIKKWVAAPESTQHAILDNIESLCRMKFTELNILRLLETPNPEVGLHRVLGDIDNLHNNWHFDPVDICSLIEAPEDGRNIVMNCIADLFNRGFRGAGISLLAHGSPLKIYLVLSLQNALTALGFTTNEMGRMVGMPILDDVMNRMAEAVPLCKDKIIEPSDITKVAKAPDFMPIFKEMLYAKKPDFKIIKPAIEQAGAIKNLDVLKTIFKSLRFLTTEDAKKVAVRTIKRLNRIQVYNQMALPEQR